MSVSRGFSLSGSCAKSASVPGRPRHCFSRAGNYRRVWRYGTRRLRSTGFVRVLSYFEEGDYTLVLGFQRGMARGKNAYSVFSRFAVNLGRGGPGQCRLFRILRWVCWPLREPARESDLPVTRFLKPFESSAVSSPIVFAPDLFSTRCVRRLGF